MNAYAIIVGAGRGVRMNSATPKQFLRLKDLPVLAYSLKAFEACNKVAGIYIVVSREDMGFCKNNVLSTLDLEKPVEMVIGGERRQDSVYNGLRSVEDHECIVAIHDGVRPFVQPFQISECITMAETTGGCILGMPVSDTLKSVKSSGIIERTVQRGHMWQAQTPQAFQYDLIRDAHEAAASEGFVGTDDASLVERYGGQISVIRGSRRNIKITNPEDMHIAEALMGLKGPNHYLL